MSRPSITRVELPFAFDEGGREYLISGDVTLGSRWPHVHGFRCVDPYNLDEIEDLSDSAVDDAEEALIAEAQRMWRTP